MVADDRTSNFLRRHSRSPHCNSDFRSIKFIRKNIDNNTSLKFPLFYSAYAAPDYPEDLTFQWNSLLSERPISVGLGTYIQQILPMDYPANLTFSMKFLARWEVGMNWSWDLHSAVASDGLPCRSNILNVIPLSMRGRYEMDLGPTFSSRCVGFPCRSNILNGILCSVRGGYELVLGLIFNSSHRRIILRI